MVLQLLSNELQLLCIDDTRQLLTKSPSHLLWAVLPIPAILLFLPMLPPLAICEMIMCSL